MTSAKNLKNLAAQLTEFWSPRVVTELEDSFIKVAKLKRQLVWHNHALEDELFMVLQGQLVIEMHSGNVVLNEGDVYVVPKGVEHNPVAANECLIMLIEKKTTAHTGEVLSPLTRSLDEQLRGI